MLAAALAVPNASLIARGEREDDIHGQDGNYLVGALGGYDLEHLTSEE